MVGAVALVLLTSAAALAQRGGNYVEQDLSPVEHTNSGFPGLFDTELVERGAAVGSFPWLNVHAGVTDNLTVGTNLLYLIPTAVLSPSGLLLTRYRVHSTEITETTMDVMVGGMKLDTKNNDITSAVGVFGSNTLLVLHDRHHLILNLLAGSFGFGFEDEENDTSTELSLYGVLAGATYRASIASWVSFQATVLPLSYLTTRVVQPSSVVEANLSRPSAYETLLYRGNVSFRTGRWLFEGGVFGIGKAPLPWLNIGLEVGR